MKVSEKGLELIRSFEGCRLIAYQCSAGRWTIGYGHTGKDVVASLHFALVQSPYCFPALFELRTFMETVCDRAHGIFYYSTSFNRVLVLISKVKNIAWS